MGRQFNHCISVDHEYHYKGHQTSTMLPTHDSHTKKTKRREDLVSPVARVALHDRVCGTYVCEIYSSLKDRDFKVVW